MLEWDDVSVERGGRRLVRRASLAVGAGELVVLAGPNGAGKSTLVRAMTGEWPVASGMVRLFGQPLAGWDRQLLAQHFAALPQQSSLAFDFLVHEVVALGRLPHGGGPADVKAVAAALAEVGLQACRGRPYLALSAGEQQRVHVARVLAQLWEASTAPSGNGPLRGALLLDEPTSALDLGHQQRLLDLLWRRARQGFATCVVLHDLNLAARYADRIVLVAGGEVMAQGTPAEVLVASRLEAAYGCTVAVRTDPDDGRPVVALAGAGRLEGARPLTS
jgi:iron complex transport system ATP-binding protein